MKVIELSIKEFEELTNELKKCIEDKEKLQKAVNYLNDEIKKYNEKFTNENDKNLQDENKN